MFCGLLVLLLAAPPVPRLVDPLPNGWAGPRKSFVVAVPGPVLTPDFTHFELELSADGGLASAFSCTNAPGSSTRYCGVFPGARDAGDYAWRARTLDGGERSAWSAEQAVRWDPDPPEAPASLSVDAVDGGFTQLSWPAATPDPLSGISYYHVVISYQPLDAGLNSDATGTTTSGLTRNLVLGPGEWEFGVHTHDLAENSTPADTRSPTRVTVPVSPGLPPPTALSYGDGGFFLTTSGGWRLRFASPMDGGAFAIAQRGVQTDGGLRPLYLRGSSDLRDVAVSQYSEGLWQLQVAHSRDGEVSDWSAPVTVMVENRAPPSPRPLSAVADGGLVALSWPEVTETGTYRSGVAGYRLDRCCTADGSVTLGWFDAGQPDASLQWSDLPGTGTWRYEARAIDRAGNVSSPAVALLNVGIAPVTITPVEPQHVSCGAVLSLDLESTGEAPAAWSLLDGPEGVTLEPSGALHWDTTRAEAGAWVLRVRAAATATVAEADLEVVVDCEPRRLGVGCSAVDGSALLLLLWALKPRGRARPGPGTP